MREKRPDDKIRTSRQPHRRVLREDDRLDERAESPLGRLMLKHVLTPEQHDAGVMYAADVGAYRSVIEAPAAIGGSGRGLDCSRLCAAAHDLLSAAQRNEVREGLFTTEVCGCLARRFRYDAAFEAVMRAGQRAAKAVARVAVWREDLAREDLVYLADGLSALARHYGLTGSRRRGHSGNAN